MLLDIESIVCDRIENEFDEEIKSAFPELNFTTVDSVDDDAKFPCVYIHLLSSPEMGADLQGDSINGMDARFEIKVTDNVYQQRAKIVQDEVLRIMKTMRFRCFVFPSFNNSSSTYCCVSRYRRIIGANDEI